MADLIHKEMCKRCTDAVSIGLNMAICLDLQVSKPACCHPNEIVGCVSKKHGKTLGRLANRERGEPVRMQYFSAEDRGKSNANA
jgi:hypothetical protein